jgi:hypothetical protein
VHEVEKEKHHSEQKKREGNKRNEGNKKLKKFSIAKLGKSNWKKS